MLFKFVLIVALYALTEISAQDVCAKGNRYRCLNLRNAKACNALEECVNIWASEPETTNVDRICNVCKDVISKVENAAESKEEEKLKKEFEHRCSSIELESDRKRCITFADELAPEVVQTMITHLSPQTICSVTESCSKSTDDEQKAPKADVSYSTLEEDGKPKDQPRPIQKRFFKKLLGFGKKAIDFYGQMKYGMNPQYGNQYGYNPYGGNPYGGNSYEGNPYGGNPYGGNPHGPYG